VAYDEDGTGIVISSDIGRRHASAWWLWQPRTDGFAIVDYDEDAGLDADEWCERLKAKIGKRKLDFLWLPHDARAKTFAAKHSAIETFIQHFGAAKVGIVPQSKSKSHSINAGQVVMRHTHFAKTACALGLSALRSWAYKYDYERKQYSKEPLDDWACDAADAFCEGAKMLQERVIEKPKKDEARYIGIGEQNTATLDDLWKLTPQQSRRI
jgi:phage terminase large subunit